MRPVFLHKRIGNKLSVYFKLLLKRLRDVNFFEERENNYSKDVDIGLKPQSVF